MRFFTNDHGSKLHPMKKGYSASMAVRKAASQFILKHRKHFQQSVYSPGVLKLKSDEQACIVRCEDHIGKTYIITMDEAWSMMD